MQIKRTEIAKLVKEFFAKKNQASTTTDYQTVDGSTLTCTGGLENGSEVTVKTDDGSQPAPDGQYELTNDQIITVVGGVISDVNSKDADEDENETSEDYEQRMRKISDMTRKHLADKGHAMPDGSFPIVTKTDLKNAIKAHGRADNPEKVKEFIKSRAKDLKATDLLPDDWKDDSDENNTEMKKQFEELAAAFENMKQEFASLKQANESLVKENSDLKQEFATQKEKNSEWEEILKNIAELPAEKPAVKPNSFKKDTDERMKNLSEALKKLKK